MKKVVETVTGERNAARAKTPCSMSAGQIARYKDSPIGQVTEQAKRDMDLIMADVLLKNWDNVIEGVKWQIDAFTELLGNLQTLKAKGALK